MLQQCQFPLNHFLLVIASLVVGLFVPLLLGEWLFLRSEGLHDAERHSTSMAALLQKDLAEQQPLAEVFAGLDQPSRLADLDHHVQEKIGHPGLLNLKVYDLTGRIIYSDRHELIGQRVEGSETLRKAMAGTVVSELITPEEYRQEYGTRTNVVMAEVSLPIRSAQNGEILYVMEAYYDYSPIQERMKGLFLVKLFSLLAIFVVILVLLAYLFNKKQTLEAKVETLESILPICQHCKKIRVETPGEPDQWQTVESFFAESKNVRFSHGICQDCLSQHYPELYERSR